MCFAATLSLVLEGRRIASGASRERKVRTPKGAMPRNPGSSGWDTRGRKVKRPFDGQCHRKSNRRSRFAGRVRVKRCGKSAPREAQATRHGKPHRVQGQIGNRGAARSARRESAAGFGYRSLRQMILSAARRRQNSAYSPAKTTSPFCPKEEVRMQNDEVKAPAKNFGIRHSYFIIPGHTAGTLKFPSRSTARIEMASGTTFSK